MRPTHDTISLIKALYLVILVFTARWSCNLCFDFSQLHERRLERCKQAVIFSHALRRS